MMMTLVESSLVVGFRSSAMPSSIAFVGSCQPSCTISAATTNDQITLYPGWCRFGSHASRTFISRGIDHLTNVNNRGLWRNGLMRRSDLLKGSVVRAAATEHSGSTSDPLERKAGIRQSYHPFEEIEESVSKPDSEEAARLSDAEMTRTMIEVNSKATLMFSGMIDDEVHDNVVWPGLPYVTDEHGDIYFKVDSDEGIMQTLASESNVVKVIIGLDNMGIFTEMGLPGQSDIDFGIEEITDEDSDDDGDYENDDEDDDDDDDDDEDWVAILDDEEDEFDSSDTLGDWANLETMRSSHPLYFARRIAEVVSNPHSGCIDLPCIGLAIQGMLRPAFFEEQSTIRKNMTSHQTDEVEKEESIQIGTAFYKLEIITIQLVSAYGNQCVVNVEDFRRARPDVIAHSAANIISRLEAGGEKIVQAFKSLCWRCKGIIVEEAAPIGVDSLGFDLRVCSGAQVQTLRFAFDTRATSEYSAERQLHDLLFPRIHPKLQNCQEAHQKDG